MAINVSNTELNHSFNTWRLNTNFIATVISNNVVTVSRDGSANRKATTVGNGHIEGTLSATEFRTNSLKAGNTSSGATTGGSLLTIGSNTTIESKTVLINANTTFTGNVVFDTSGIEQNRVNLGDVSRIIIGGGTKGKFLRLASSDDNPEFKSLTLRDITDLSTNSAHIILSGSNTSFQQNKNSPHLRFSGGVNSGDKIDFFLAADATAGRSDLRLLLTDTAGESKFVIADSANNIVATIDSNGNATFEATMDVDGATTLNSTLDVDGATTLNSTLDVDGATTLNSTLDVDGATTLNDTTQSTSTTTGALQVDGGVGIVKNVHIGGSLDVAGITNINDTTQSTSATSGALVVDGGVGVAMNLNADGNLGVKGDSTLDGTLAVKGATTILDGTLAVKGASTTVDGNLAVKGATTTLDGTLAVKGASTTVDGTLAVKGASTTLDGTLNVKGATDLDSTLNVDGDSTLNGTLAVKGATTILDGTLAVKGASTTVDGTLAVKGASTTLDGTLNVKGATDLDATLNVDGATTLNGLKATTIEANGDIKLNSAGINYGTTAILSAGNGKLHVNNAITSGTIENTHIKDSTIANGKLVNPKYTVGTTAGSGSDFDVNLGNTINFNGTANEVDVSLASGTVTFGLPDDVTVAGQLNVTENVVVTGNSVLTGSMTANGATINIGKDWTAEANSQVARAAYANGALTTLQVYANTVFYDRVSLPGGVDIQQSASLNNLTVSNDALVQGQLNVSENVVIAGNLEVKGTTTTINTTNIDIGDNIIKLNGDLTNVTTPSQNAGIAVNRGNAANVEFRWNETNDYWEATNDGTRFDPILTANGASISGRTELGNGQVASGDFLLVLDADDTSVLKKATITNAALQGVKGEKGQKGQKGDNGAKGQKGEKGDKGQKGEKGEKGEKGIDGISVKGDPGTSVKGDKGQKGQKGEKGEKGIDGISVKGDPGASVKGDKGQKGDDGASVKGQKGQKGESVKGDSGASVKGDKGQKGQPGASVKGDTGASVKGEKGQKGQKGQDGASVKGDPGASVKGDKGQKGESVKGDSGASVKGDKGQKGQPGASVKGDTGASVKGEKGQKGEKGEKGQKGEKGAGGSKGQKGEEGPNGTDLRGSSNVDKWWGNSQDYIWMDTDVGMKFYTNITEDMRLTDGGDLHVDGDVIAYSTTVSDEKLKENIARIENALDLLSKIDGVTFNLKKDGTKSAGVIAQQVEKVLPSAVKSKTVSLDEDLDGQEYKTVQYDQLSALFIEAIKELKGEVDELRAMIEELKG